MKITFLIFLTQILSVYGALCQQITYQQLSTMQKVPASGAKYGSYLSKDGSLYMVGAKIKYGIPRGGVFTFIWYGDGAFTEITYANANLANVETEITEIVVGGSKKMGFRVFFKTRPRGGMISYKVDFENAVEVGEIKPYGMTSDEALAELKKAKDKLDLGLITQAKYDSIKGILSTFIK